MAAEQTLTVGAPRRVRRPAPVILRTAQDVHVLLRRMRTSLVMPRVAIEIATLSPADRRRHGDRLHAHSRACGCSTGSFVGALGLLAWIAYLIVTVGSPGAWRLTDLLLGAALSLGLAVVGKLFGLIRARRRYVGELRALLQTVG